MDFPDYLNVDCSEDEAAEAAEVEANLYSKIYYDQEVTDESVKLYSEVEVIDSLRFKPTKVIKYLIKIINTGIFVIVFFGFQILC